MEKKSRVTAHRPFLAAIPLVLLLVGCSTPFEANLAQPPADPAAYRAAHTACWHEAAAPSALLHRMASDPFELSTSEDRWLHQRYVRCLERKGYKVARDSN